MVSQNTTVKKLLHEKAFEMTYGRPGYISLLWKLEAQLDAINQHSRIALSIVRKELDASKRKK